MADPANISMDEFISDCLVDLVACNICHNRFYDNEPPVVMRPHKCQHVFHRPCIIRWFETIEQAESNACPVCRTRLFTRDRQAPNFSENTQRDPAYVENLYNQGERMEFVFQLHKTLWETYHPTDNLVTSREIEDKMDAVLRIVGEMYWYDPYYIRADHRAALYQVSKDIITVHFERAQYDRMTRQEHDEWYQKVSDALEWPPNHDPQNNDDH